MAKKPHPADLYAAEQIARAVRFSAFYSAGRDGTVSIECATAAEAIATADQLTRDRGRFGRRAIAYAITPEGVSFPIGVDGYRGRAGAMLSERSPSALSPLPSSAPLALSPLTATPPNQKDIDMSKPALIARKFNADRAALRAATRTGQPHTIQTVAGGYIVVPVQPAAETDRQQAIAKALRLPARASAKAVEAATKASKVRYFSGTDGDVTVFRASPTMTYNSATFSAGNLSFSKAPAKFGAVGSFDVNEITKEAYEALVALKAKRLNALGRRDTVPSDSWVPNAELAAAPGAKPHPNQCTECGVKFSSYAAKAKHLCGFKGFHPAPSKAEPEAPKLARRRRPLAAKPGEMPTPPDFTANTHKPYRKKLEALIALAAAGDAEGLAAVAINPTSTSPKALIRYRDAAVAAIRARA